MTPENVCRCIESVQSLPLTRQAQCVRLAAERSLPVWREWCRHRSMEDVSSALLECFDRWVAGTASEEDLQKLADGHAALLPQDLRKERQPAGGYAGYALADMTMIAL